MKKKGSLGIGSWGKQEEVGFLSLGRRVSLGKEDTSCSACYTEAIEFGDAGSIFFFALNTKKMLSTIMQRKLATNQ